MTEKKPIGDSQFDISDSFKNTRERYGMSQKKWADAIGISYSLVKKIEAHTIAYSYKTQDKVKSFINRHPIIPEEYKLHELKDYILFDIIKNDIDRETRLENVEPVYKCIHHLQELISNAKQCNSSKELFNYFEFLHQLLYAAKSAASDNMDLIRHGKFPSAMEKNLKSAFSHISDAGPAQASKKSNKNSQIEGQSTLFDL